MGSELHDDFAAWWNALGKALTTSAVLLLTLLATILEGAAKGIRIARAWILAGCKLPNWIFPRHTKGQEP
jgi:hypothetical protein